MELIDKAIDKEDENDVEGSYWWKHVVAMDKNKECARECSKITKTSDVTFERKNGFTRKKRVASRPAGRLLKLIDKEDKKGCGGILLVETGSCNGQRR